MSSHHIIRDDQEPALIIANGESCHTEILGQLLEWSPLVVVLDGAISRVLDLDIKVDVLLGDFDRNIDSEKIAAQQSDIQMVYLPDQNKTDLEKALEFLIEAGHKAVNIVWATGKRSDHSITNITNIVRYKNQLKIVLIDNHSKIFPIDKVFEKWYVAGTPISLIPVGQATGITTSGLKYNLNDEELILGFRSGNSNEALKDGFVKIAVQSGELLLMECWD
ncbi:MAG: thiamine diphosphokinase [Bacteroidota bacterium]